MSRASFFYERFLSDLPYEATSCQDALFRDIADFLTTEEGDILVVNGYAGTGKTTAIAAVVQSLSDLEIPVVLLAPTGRSAKVLSSYTGKPAFTIHKHIYRQKSVGEDGFGEFSLSQNRAKGTLFIVDEVSLIGIDQGGGGAAFGSGNLLEDLVRFVRDGALCRLILIGDSAQLPPVGLDKSPALSPEYMSFAGGVHFSELTTVVRQHRESGILSNATALRHLISASSCSLALSDRFPDVVRVSGGELLDVLTDAYSEYGEDETVILCRSNRRANRYNMGIRSQVQYKEEMLVRGDKLMIVKNCYQFVDGVDQMDYIANGDMAKLVKVSGYEERYGLTFADAVLTFPDYDDATVRAKICLDTLTSEAPALTYEQQNILYQGVNADYSHITSKKKRYEAVREDPFFNALQLKYAEAVTGHKSQGGQWKCVFVDNPLWHEDISLDDLKWLYTAFTRATQRLYLVNFPDKYFL